MAQEIKMSAAGLKAMQEELEYLKTVRRKELAEEIKEARSHGDLSENSEYDEAKNTQGLVENRITELEQMVKNARRTATTPCSWATATWLRRSCPSPRRAT